MNEIYCKAGRVELTKKEAFEIYEQKKYIATSTAIYQPQYSQAQKAVYFTQISTIKGIAKRGHFYKLTAQEINHILGYEYLAV